MAQFFPSKNWAKGSTRYSSNSAYSESSSDPAKAGERVRDLENLSASTGSSSPLGRDGPEISTFCGIVEKSTIYSIFCLTWPVDWASFIKEAIKMIIVQSHQGVENESEEDARARSASKKI